MNEEFIAEDERQGLVARLVASGRVDDDGIGIVWSDEGRLWSLWLDGGALLFSVDSPSGWHEVARHRLHDDEAWAFDELVRLLTWLEDEVSVRKAPRAKLATLLLEAVQQLVGGQDAAETGAQLRHRLRVGLAAQVRLRKDAPWQLDGLAQLLDAWHGVHALRFVIERDVPAIWIDPVERSVQRVTVCDRATVSTIWSLPVRIGLRWRLLRQARARRRTSGELAIVSTGRWWGVVPQAQLSRALPDLPHIAALAS